MYVDDLMTIRMVTDARCAQDGDCCTRIKLDKFLAKHSANLYTADDGRVYILARTLSDDPYFMDAVTGSLFDPEGQHMTNADRRMLGFVKCTVSKAKSKLQQQFKRAEQEDKE